jgi:predicted pyridoxine 5'-phosphate oxidase superfamily flavin-nucleotide-binding protein
MDPLPGPFHAGEIAVQQRTGVADEARVVGRSIAPSIMPAAGPFLAAQRMAVAASLDTDGRPWASLLTGPPGFLHAVDERLLRASVRPRPGDPLGANLRARSELALIVLDPWTRRRMRFNGRGLLREDGVFLLADQVYGNCTKYIQKRRLVAEVEAAPGQPSQAAHLDPRQRGVIAAADTFFIASDHPVGGADASHRGGRPGFVRVPDDRHVAFSDYAGNNMFNTLGNLAEYPRAGLLFVDFESGDLLQLSGPARLEAGPEREVVVEVELVLESRAASPLRWELVEFSPAIP